jgi:hypothetical protein
LTRFSIVQPSEFGVIDGRNEAICLFAPQA